MALRHDVIGEVALSEPELVQPSPVLVVDPYSGAGSLQEQKQSRSDKRHEGIIERPWGRSFGSRLG